MLLPVAQGLTVSDTLADGLTVTKLLTTSDSAFSKLDGYDMKNYDKADGDIAGPFALGLAIDKALENGLETKIVWFSSGALLDETASITVSGVA